MCNRVTLNHNHLNHTFNSCLFFLLPKLLQSRSICHWWSRVRTTCVTICHVELFFRANRTWCQPWKENITTNLQACQIEVKFNYMKLYCYHPSRFYNLITLQSNIIWESKQISDCCFIQAQINRQGKSVSYSQFWNTTTRLTESNLTPYKFKIFCSSCISISSSLWLGWIFQRHDSSHYLRFLLRFMTFCYAFFINTKAITSKQSFITQLPVVYITCKALFQRIMQLFSYESFQITFKIINKK